MMCVESYNGNCNIKCKHLMPHKEGKECKELCERMKIKTECIEVEYAERIK